MLENSEPADRPSRDMRRRRRTLIKLAGAQDNLCFYCDKEMSFSEPDRRYDSTEQNMRKVASFDHVIPKSQNGRNGSNLVIAHRQCNSVRARRELTEEETEKLNRLNERRAHLFHVDSGKTSPSTFGVISACSIALAEQLDDPDTTSHQRKAVCSFINKYLLAVKSVASIKEPDAWRYITNLILQDYLNKLEKHDLPFKTYIAATFQAHRKNEIHKRRA